VKFIMIAILCLIVLALVGWIVMSLWNWLAPALFGFKTITYWQALGLMILCKMLFGGFSGARGGAFRRRLRMQERWEQMTPEEREKFRQGMRDCWTRTTPPTTPPPNAAPTA
jgi:hypothetical protein